MLLSKAPFPFIVYIISSCIPTNWTHDLDIASTMHYCLSYNNAYSVYSGFDLNLLAEIVQKSDSTNLFFQI